MIESAFEFLVKIVLNAINNFIPNILKLFSLPTFSISGTDFLYLWHNVGAFVIYIKDASFVSSSCINYVILSIIFRISAKASVYLIKLLIAWYHNLMP